MSMPTNKLLRYKNEIQVFTLNGATLEIRQLDEQGRLVALQFSLDNPQADNWQWVYWQNGLWQRFEPEKARSE